MFISAQFLCSLSICCLVNELSKPGEMGWKPVGVEGDLKVRACGDGREDAARRLSVPWSLCVRTWVYAWEREGGCWWMFLAEADSNHISVCTLLKVLFPVKVEKFEKIDKSPVITRNYFHAWITSLNMRKQLDLKHFPLVCIFFYLMPFSSSCWM